MLWFTSAEITGGAGQCDRKVAGSNPRADWEDVHEESEWAKVRSPASELGTNIFFWKMGHFLPQQPKHTILGTVGTALVFKV